MYFDRYSPRSSHRAVVDGVAPGPHIMVVPEHVLPGYAPGMKPRPTEAVVFGRYPAFDEVLADPRSDCVQHGPPRSLGAVQDVEVRPVTVCTVQAGSPVQPGQPDSAPPAGTVNLALHAPVRAGGGPTATPPALATDGDVDDDGSGRSVASVDRTWQPWLEVDLGAVHDVTAITIWPRRGECCRERLRGIYVFTTADPIRTDDPVSIRQVAGISSAFLDGMVSVPTRVDVGQRARYVRLQGLDTNYLDVAEVQVWGPSGP
jgi:hypothetical protein